jgi:hypothetical protein
MRTSIQCRAKHAIFIAGTLLFSASIGQPQSSAQSMPTAEGPVVEMEPYIVRGERILPNPEAWFYVNIPALEIKRGGRVVYMPGYEILSSRSRQNSLVLAGSLQLRQVANALVFPDFVRSLPRTAVIVVLDDGRLRENIQTRAWEGDSLYTANALRQYNGEPDVRYSIGTQINAHFYGDFVTEIPSGYAENTDHEMLDTDRERYVRESRVVAGMVGIAANGGPLTVYLDDTRRSVLQRPMPRPYGSALSGLSDSDIPLERKPGSLLSNNRMDENGVVSESAFGRELSQRLVLLTRQIFRRNEPEWLRAGFGELCRNIQVSTRQVEFGEFPELIRITPPKLADVLMGERRRPSVRHGTWMAAVFIHYCLYAGDGTRGAKFFNFVGRLENEPFSEALFMECFGKKVSAVHSDIIVHWHRMTSKKRLIYKWDTPPLPGIVAREATQSEVARLKAEVLIARGQSPKALDELRIAYWRGERDPWMLALLALLEEHIGLILRAEKITKTLLASPQVPARAHVVAAKLRLRELGAGAPGRGKLNRDEADSVMEHIIKAREQGLLNEDLCATLAKLVFASEAPPDASITGFLTEAARRYPLNQAIAAALKTGDSQAHEPPWFPRCSERPKLETGRK